MSDERRRAPHVPGDLLLHPVAVLALATWIVNDHWLKDAFPSALTGKLSDVASLAFFPLLPIAARELARARREVLVRPSRAWALGWIAVTGAVMAAINTNELAAEAYRVGLGLAQQPIRAALAGAWVAPCEVALWMDPSDLLTLPALAVPLWLAWSRGEALAVRPTRSCA